MLPAIINEITALIQLFVFGEGKADNHRFDLLGRVFFNRHLRLRVFEVYASFLPEVSTREQCQRLYKIKPRPAMRSEVSKQEYYNYLFENKYLKIVVTNPVITLNDVPLIKAIRTESDKKLAPEARKPPVANNNSMVSPSQP